MNRRRFLQILRVLWIIAGLSFTLWMGLSYQAREVPAQLLRSDEDLTVQESAASVSFTPQHSAKPLTFIFLPGGLVDPHAYVPLAHALAEQGFQTIILKLPFRSAPLASQEAAVYDQILALIQAAPTTHQWVLGGHSRGGAIAARFAHRYPERLRGLVLLATSHPKEAAGDLSSTMLEVLKIYASLDGLASETEIEATRVYLPADATLVRIEGGNHAQFGWYGSQLGDQTATISREEQQRLILEALVEMFTQLARD